MAGIGKNLYPPIVPTYQTPFVYTDECRIYFSLPPSNNLEDFSNEVQVTISTQNDNRSAFKRKDFPVGIMCINYLIDENIKGDNKYYIQIDKDEIEGGFSPEVYYKVQIRLSKTKYNTSKEKTSKPQGISPTHNWINKNLDNFSEWSTITLVKSIYEPKFSLNPFTETNRYKTIIFSTSFQTLSGTLTFVNKEEGARNQKTTEYLKNYRIKIYRIENSKKQLYADSGVLTPVNKNEVYYNIKKKIDDENDYSVEIELYTNNGYTLKQDGYNFSIFKTIDPETKANISVTPDYANGRAKIEVSLDSFSIVNNFAIKRASSIGNFLFWEDVHYCSFYNEEDLKYEWYDYTLESGVLYQYAIQRINVFNGTRGREKIATDENNNSSIIMLPLEDIFLTTAGMQFKVKFDPNISSFKTHYLESKTETIGSKFPFIRRNGKVKYRTFPISGLITAFCDEEGTFLNKDNLYNEEEKIYYDGQSAGYNITNGITAHQDFVYEKLFREKIMSFLQEDSVKLFRSATEGNIIVKLMDINFTPNKTLGRMLYSFSATAIEVADCTIENYDSYGIQYLQKENLKAETTKSMYKIGQINDDTGEYFNWDINIVKYISNNYANKLSKYNRETETEIEASVKSLKWIRLTFNSGPVLIYKGDKVENPKVIFEGDANIKTLNNNAYLGYLINVNKETVFVNKNGVYELTGEDVDITTLKVPVNSKFTLDYMAEIVYKEKDNKATFKTRVLKNSVGQIYDRFDIEEKFVEKIQSKYIVIHPNFTQSFSLLGDITIEADRGTILNIIQKDTNKSTVHEIGESNILKFKDEYKDGIFSDFYFSGRRLYEKESQEEIYLKVSSNKGLTKTILASDYQDNEGDYPYIIKIMDKFGNLYIAEDEYLNLSDLQIVNENVVKVKANNCVFKKEDGTSIICYKNKWYPFVDEVVQCPTNALIDYTYTLIREEY